MYFPPPPPRMLIPGVCYLFAGTCFIQEAKVVVCSCRYGGSLVLDGGMTAGELTAFLVYSLYVGINFGQVCVCVFNPAL